MYKWCQQQTFWPSQQSDSFDRSSIRCYLSSYHHPIGNRSKGLKSYLFTSFLPYVYVFPKFFKESLGSVTYIGLYNNDLLTMPSQRCSRFRKPRLKLGLKSNLAGAGFELGLEDWVFEREAQFLLDLAYARLLGLKLSFGGVGPLCAQICPLDPPTSQNDDVICGRASSILQAGTNQLGNDITRGQVANYSFMNLLRRFGIKL